jgi:predicted permease
LQQRLERIPGVRTVTFSRVALLSRVRQNNRIAVTGLTLPADAAFGVNINGLAPNFFDAMGLPIVLGRGFTERDNASAPNVVVVNQSLAQKYFGGENPIGREIVHSYGPFETVRSQVVGVAADAKYTDLRSAVPPTMYVAAAQRPGGEANFALRLAVPPGGLVNAIRAAVREIDPSLPVLNLRTLDEQIDRLHGQERLFARLSGFFGVLALGLASVGLYGLMSYAAQRRTNEIGLRIALGAVPAHVLRMMLGESLAIVGAGIAAGVAGAWASSRLVASMLYGLSPADPLTYLSVAIVLIVVALLASLLPALRASRVDPMTALRAE